ncbi:CinA family protein [Reinekea marina]|uniref:CinA family protein n=1 Tax=Reinekea marina TaxID=1310421 RepID=A0ABV7WRE6_9GAMM|nr:CinA family protein [Reinekea marina]MDN3650324.1 CinA family protein [Reinekea marina]
MNLSEVARLLELRNETLVTIESCTGGGIAALCTSIPGSSVWFDGGWVTYSNEMKMKLGVPRVLIDDHGAVSKQVAEAMAASGQAESGADWAISVTGVAGPGGGSVEKPVGLVWFGLASKSAVYSFKRYFRGDRETIRRQTVEFALEQLTLYLR